MPCPSPRLLLLCTTAALALGSASPLVAQAADPQPEDRRPTFVRVLGPTGEPVVGAEVTFAGGNPALGEAALPGDVQVVATDARGRARARLRTGLCYVAWAIAPLGAGAGDGEGAGDRSKRVLFGRSNAGDEDYFGAGALFELRCRPLGRRALPRATEPAAWADVGPLEFLLVTPRPGAAVPLPRDGPLLRWPAIPGHAIEVRDRAGDPLWSTRTLPVLPGPQPLTVRAVDEDGEPVAGARVRLRVGVRGSWSDDAWREPAIGRFRELGTTGADGRVTVRVPAAGDPLSRRPGSTMLFVDAPGRAMVAGGMLGRYAYRNDRRVDAHDGDELVFTLPQVPVLQTAAAAVPPGSVGQLVAKCKLRGGGTSYRHDPRTFFATAGTDGVLTFDHVPVDVHSLRLLVVPPAGRPVMVFEALEGRTLPPDLMPIAAQEGPLRLGRLDVQALDPRGGPARGVVVTVVSAESNGARQRDSAFRFPLDATGRGLVQLGRGRWIALVLSPAGHAAEEFAIDATGKTVELRLAPLGAMPVELRGSQGEPIADARVQVAGSRALASESALQRTQHLLAERVARAWEVLRTDAEGRVEVPFLPLDSLAWRASLSWSGGQTAEFPVESRDSPLPLRPR